MRCIRWRTSTNKCRCLIPRMLLTIMVLSAHLQMIGFDLRVGYLLECLLNQDLGARSDWLAGIQSLAMHPITQHENGVTAFVIGLVFTLPRVSISLQFKPTTSSINMGVRDNNSGRVAHLLLIWRCFYIKQHILTNS